MCLRSTDHDVNYELNDFLILGEKIYKYIYKYKLIIINQSIPHLQRSRKQDWIIILTNETKNEKREEFFAVIKELIDDESLLFIHGYDDDDEEFAKKSI